MKHSPFIFAAILSIYLTPVQSSNGEIDEFNELADINSDGSIDVLDIVQLVNIILN